jgi:dTMP kinase
MPLTSVCCAPLGQSGRLAGIRAAPAAGSIAAATLGFVTGKRGRFLTIEGPDGSGKTTQVERLVERLRAAGRPVVVTREPGGTRLGEQLREILLARHGGVEATDALTDAFLFEAARRHLVRQVIRPALEDEAIVVCGRYSDSTFAYQGYGAGVPLETLRALDEVATEGLHPDLTILLDLAPEVGLARVAPDDVTRFEAEHDLAFHRRVRDGFLRLAAEAPERFVIVDATRSADEVGAEVWHAVEAWHASAASEPSAPSVRMIR